MPQEAFWCVCVCVCVCVCECMCCVCDILEQVCGIEYAAGGFVLCVCVCVLRVGHFWPGFGERVCSRWLCAVCVCVCVCVLRVGEFREILGD